MIRSPAGTRPGVVPRVVVAPDAAGFPASFAGMFHDRLTEALAGQPTLFIAVSGGRTPGPFFRELARRHRESGFDWSKRVQWFPVDERNVPAGHPDSNQSMIRATLFPPDSRLGLFHDQQVRPEAPEDTARAFAGQLTSLPRRNGLPCFDYLLLGIGLDGHTASLFPGCPWEAPSTEWVRAFWVEPLKCHRYSLSYEVIAQARHRVFLVAGAEKAPILARILSGAAPETPAGRLATTTATEWWLSPDCSPAPHPR